MMKSTPRYYYNYVFNLLFHFHCGHGQNVGICAEFRARPNIFSRLCEGEAQDIADSYEGLLLKHTLKKSLSTVRKMTPR